MIFSNIFEIVMLFLFKEIFSLKSIKYISFTIYISSKFSYYAQATNPDPVHRDSTSKQEVEKEEKKTTEEVVDSIIDINERTKEALLSFIRIHQEFKENRTGKEELDIAREKAAKLTNETLNAKEKTLKHFLNLNSEIEKTRINLDNRHLKNFDEEVRTFIDFIKEVIDKALSSLNIIETMKTLSIYDDNQEQLFEEIELEFAEIYENINRQSEGNLTRLTDGIEKIMRDKSYQKSKNRVSRGKMKELINDHNNKMQGLFSFLIEIKNKNQEQNDDLLNLYDKIKKKNKISVNNTGKINFIRRGQRKTTKLVYLEIFFIKLSFLKQSRPSEEKEMMKKKIEDYSTFLNEAFNGLLDEEDEKSLKLILKKFENILHSYVNLPFGYCIMKLWNILTLFQEVRIDDKFKYTLYNPNLIKLESIGFSEVLEILKSTDENADEINIEALNEIIDHLENTNKELMISREIMQSFLMSKDYKEEKKNARGNKKNEHGVGDGNEKEEKKEYSITPWIISFAVLILLGICYAIYSYKSKNQNK